MSGSARGRRLVAGFARTGVAVARALGRLGEEVLAIDDAPSPDALAQADRLGVELVVAPGPERLAQLVGAVEEVVVSPGLSPAHPVFAAARSRGVPVISEVELAFRLGLPPLVAITGTNGKTTVTSLVAAMLARSGRAVSAAGNIGRPLVDLAGEPDPAAPGPPRPELVVAEVSSFQLAFCERFRPTVGTWLNLAEDHLDWHRDLDDYAAAKARIWARQGPDDVAVANAEDAVVLEHARAARSRLVTFGLAQGDYRVDGELLVAAGKGVVASRADLFRDLPHDRANALAAIATAVACGASLDACRRALSEHRPLRHRVELVGRHAGVEYFDDSKATTPSAVIAALAGFGSVVLIAGGRNKGLDLGAIAEALRASTRRPEGTAGKGGARLAKLRGVVAIGESAEALASAFSPEWPVVAAPSMSDAVEAAARLAQPGDAVLLSPGCASFDWYSSYEERGDDFARAVKALPALEGR